MTETWETYDNVFHYNKNDPKLLMKKENIDMKWIQLPDELGKKKSNVVEKSYQNCKCKKHKTMVYVLEDDIFCFHCNTFNGFVFAYK